MLSIIITAYKEHKTIGKAIEAFLNQLPKNSTQKSEILVLCPDKKTADAAKKYSKTHKQVRHIQDPGRGKPAALNLAFKKAKGDILILTDGDVYVDKGSVQKLIKKISKPNIGAVTARPISTSPKNTMLGFWSHLLTDAGAHKTRLQRSKKVKFIDVSGYLYAMKNIIAKIPEDALSDDAVISQMIWQKGLKIGYEPEAKVFVKYPTTFNDWILQKRRSAQGYSQLSQYFTSRKKMRSFRREAFLGWYKAVAYPKTLKEMWWTALLFIARIYLWSLIFYDQKIKKREFSEVWKRVESTK